MLKYALAALAVIPMVAPAANAEGFYVFSDVKSTWEGDDYERSRVRARVGYEKEITETTSAYLELGPEMYLLQDESADTRLALEVGGETELTEGLNLYGDVEMITGPLNDYKTKIGLRYEF